MKESKKSRIYLFTYTLSYIHLEYTCMRVDTRQIVNSPSR